MTNKVTFSFNHLKNMHFLYYTYDPLFSCLSDKLWSNSYLCGAQPCPQDYHLKRQDTQDKADGNKNKRTEICFTVSEFIFIYCQADLPSVTFVGKWQYSILTTRSHKTG